MRQISVSEISILTGAARATCVKRLAPLSFVEGEKGAKLYASEEALRAIYLGNGETPQDLLALKRTEEIELGMEVTRGKRVPIETVQQLFREAYSNINGILKAQAGKVIDEQIIEDMLANIRAAQLALPKVHG